MKVFKEKTQSLFPKPFGVGGKMMLGVGVMVFFDLTDTENLLTEQDLWKAVPAQLGPQPIVDLGMPKPRGEVLVAGSCFAPRGETRSASRVRIRVGTVDKSLDIFGDRFWKKKLITDPVPFSEMPLVWANAFGGPEFEKNPLGKGTRKLPMPDGTQRTPLPNIENPRHLIGSSSDLPEPAGVGMLDLRWPQRAGKNGTYDKKWLEKRWPYLPDDQNYEFFNAAPEDQYIDGFFSGGEPVAIEKMHPDMPVINASLPRLRIRCFATLNTEFKRHVFPVGPLPSQPLRDSDEFREITTHLETVWLFPSILRGLCIYRGTTGIMDEEYGDVLRVLIRQERADEAPKSIDHYFDLQRRLLDRRADIDMAPFEAAMKKQQAALKRVRNVPKWVDEMRQNALGNRPSMPMPEPEEMLAMSKKQITGHLARLDKLEATARKLHAEHGHRIEMNLGMFERFRAKLADMDAKIEETATKLSATKKKLLAQRDQTVKAVTGRIKALKAKYPDQIGDIPGQRIPENFPFNKTVNPWHDRGFPIVVACRKLLENDDEAMKTLTDLGLERRTIRRTWLGINKQARTERPMDWGLDAKDAFNLPAGLLLPRFDGSVLKRVTAFTTAIPARFRGEHMVVPGSDLSPLFCPSATLIDLPTMPPAESAPVIRAADELQALYVEQEVGDCCSIISLASPGEKPGKAAAEAIKTAAVMLVILPAEWDKTAEGQAQWAAWQAAFPNAEPLGLAHGRTVFADRAKGADIRAMIFERLPADYASTHSTEIALPEKGKPPGNDFMKGFKPPLPADIPGLVAGVLGEVKAAKEKKFGALRGAQQKGLQQVSARVAEMAKKQGVDIASAKSALAPPPGPGKSHADLGKEIAGKIRAQRDKLKQTGRLPAEAEAKMTAEAERAEKMGAEGEARRQAMKAELASKKNALAEGMKKLKAMSLPDEGKAKLRAHGMDPDKMKPRSREEIVAMHARGESLALAILSGVDLSGLDLSGADFSGCRLKQTNFKDAVLNDAVFGKCMASGADFSGASLKNANMTEGLFNKAKFRKADLSHAECRKTVLKDVDLSEAKAVGANIDMAILDGADLTGADLSGARLNMAIARVKANGTRFHKSTITKCLFKKAELEGADFSGAAIHNTLFNGVKGRGADFAGANLDHVRTGGNSEFQKADFSGATLKQAGLRDTDLTEAKFTGADLGQALVDNCMLVNADFTRASAKQARFSKSNLEGALMRAVNLMTGSLRKARLVNTDLRDSNLFSVDFYGSVVGGTRFEGANLKRTQLYKRLDLLEKK